MKMSNMAYCRFQNTASDLLDCWDNWDLDEDASAEEKKARERLIKLCVRIAENYGPDA